jgi:glycosyltransferase involved in cell wall biosynthesis
LIRYGGIARYLNKKSNFNMEMYRPWRRYDAVVFVKMMNPRCQKLAHELKNKGTQVLFDANVNYYEEEGDYIVPGTRPTPEQKMWATSMTSLADAVVADSQYLADVCRLYNPVVEWIPDAVDTDFFSPAPKQKDKTPGKLKLVWSGVGKKARPLELIEPVLMKLKDRVELEIITSPNEPHNIWSDVMERLVKAGIAKISLYSYKTYPHSLRKSDVIISPRFLENAYEKAHTEYKITLGMSAGLPALASPQMSYLEALKNGGGIICHSVAEWERALNDFIDHPEKRREMGLKARQQVQETYSIPAVAKKYGTFLLDSLNERS